MLDWSGYIWPASLREGSSSKSQSYHISLFPLHRICYHKASQGFRGSPPVPGRQEVCSEELVVFQKIKSLTTQSPLSKTVTSGHNQVDCSFDRALTLIRRKTWMLLWFLGVPRLFSALQTEFLQNMITTFIPRWVEFRGAGANFPSWTLCSA